jgi:CheY-like chemotaxis protein
MNAAFFSMLKLLQSDEIDARGAIRDLGRDLFIKYLNEFMDRAPHLGEILNKITADSIKESPGNKAVLNRNLTGLQDLAIRIYALKLPYDIESLMAVAKRDNFTNLDKFLNKIKASIEAIVAMIKNAAEGDVAVDVPVENPEENPGLPEITDTSPKGILNAETFYNLSTFINIPEIAKARDELLRLAAFNFGEEGNKFVRDVYAQLNNPDEAQSLCTGFINHLKETAVTKRVVLAVDDQPDVLNTLKGILNKEYSFFGVTHHAAAIKFLGTRVPDLIILDIEMPGVDGFALFSLIRKVERFAHIPIVFFSSNASLEYAKTAIALGARGYLRKPIEAETLLMKVAEFIWL